MRDIQISGFGWGGTFLEHFEDSYFENVIVRRCGREGMLFYGLRKSNLQGCRFINLGPGAPSGSTINGTAPWKNVYGGHATRRPQAVSAGVSSLHAFPPSEDVNFTDCHAVNCWSWEGFDTHGGRRINFKGCTVTGSYMGVGVSEADTTGLDGDCPAREITVSGVRVDSKGAGHELYYTGTVSGGSMSLTVTVNGTTLTTSAITYSSVAATMRSNIKTALEALASLDSVWVMGSGLNVAGSTTSDPFLIRHQDDALLGRDVTITVNAGGLTGGGSATCTKVVGPAINAGSAPGPDSDGALGFSTLTTALTGANNDLIYTASTLGERGNLQVGYIVSGNNTALSVAGPQTFTVDTATDIFTATAHKFAAGTRVEVSSTDALPTSMTYGGLSDGGTYYVRDVTTNTFKLAEYPTGAAIDISTAGTGTLTVTPKDVIVTVATNGGGTATSTATQVKAAVEANSTTNALVTITNAAANTGAGTVVAMALAYLTGGDDGMGGIGLTIENCAFVSMGSIRGGDEGSGHCVRISNFGTLSIVGNQFRTPYRGAINLKADIRGFSILGNTIINPVTSNGVQSGIHLETDTATGIIDNNCHVRTYNAANIYEAYSIPTPTTTLNTVPIAYLPRIGKGERFFGTVTKWRADSQLSDTVASAAALALYGHTDFFNVTGTTSVTSITGDLFSGRIVVLRTAGSLTVTNGNNIKIGSNAVMDADDTLALVCDGTNFYRFGGAAN
jgi:hypothetical protein